MTFIVCLLGFFLNRVLQNSFKDNGKALTEHFSRQSASLSHHLERIYSNRLLVSSAASLTLILVSPPTTLLSEPPQVTAEPVATLSNVLCWWTGNVQTHSPSVWGEKQILCQESSTKCAAGEILETRQTSISQQ